MYVPLAKFLHRKGFLTRAACRVTSLMLAVTSFNSFDDHDVGGLDSDIKIVDFHDVGDDQQNKRRQNIRKNSQVS